MKRTLLLLAALFASSAAMPAAERPPNLLLIYSDDHGWADLGAQGVDQDIRTPNLDQLARDGVRFARGYVSAPQCVPSRAGVLTGRYQQKFGVEDNHKGPLPLAELTMAERLKPAGYVSGQVGKWHLDIGGNQQGGRAAKSAATHLPHAQGFEEYWCGSLRQYHASHDLKGQPLADAPKLVTDDRFRVVVQTDAALSFLERRATKPEQPWFLYLAWFAPHVPLESPEPWFSRTPATLPKERRQALAMIAGMDDGLGRIRAKLKAMGAEQNTLIFFIGDNGAPVKEGAWDGSLNLPLIGEKGMLTDGGIRTPFVAAWPGKIPAGQSYEHPVISLDVAATVVALAGAPHDAKLDGVNLIPFLTGEKKSAPHDALYWRWRSQAAVLEYPWKLIHLGEKERYLFNVTQPDGETANLLAQNPDIAARLEARLKTWSAALQPPGAPAPNNDQDNLFFAAHVDQTSEHPTRRRPAAKAAAKPAAPQGSVQGWLCRNAALAVQDGALVITPEPGAKAVPFLTHAALDLPGPATVTLRVRVPQGGRGAFAWRTTGQKDFTAENTASFEWPSSAEWQVVKVELPVKGTLRHLRMTWPKAGASLEVQAITLVPAKGKPSVFDFSPAPSTP